MYKAKKADKAVVSIQLHWECAGITEGDLYHTDKEIRVFFHEWLGSLDQKVSYVIPASHSKWNTIELQADQSIPVKVVLRLSLFGDVGREQETHMMIKNLKSTLEQPLSGDLKNLITKLRHGPTVPNCEYTWSVIAYIHSKQTSFTPE